MYWFMIDSLQLHICIILVIIYHDIMQPGTIQSYNFSNNRSHEFCLIGDKPLSEPSMLVVNWIADRSPAQPNTFWNANILRDWIVSMLAAW